MTNAGGRSVDGASANSREPPRLVFLANGDSGSAAAERARAFAQRLRPEFDASVILRSPGRLRGLRVMLAELRRQRPNLLWVVDLAATGILAAAIQRRFSGTPWVTDTGDDIVELGRVLGRGPLRMFATRQLERIGLSRAAAVVVRGSRHRERLGARGIVAEFIPDGVDVDTFREPARGERPGGGTLTIGLVGSVVWIPTRNTCYGMEMVELLGRLRDRPDVRGLLVGDGSGLDRLRRRAAELGVLERIEFAGRVPPSELPPLLARMDVCLSTQSNDAIGEVRTTGKLPLYLAAGRFILASRVGEAARVLPPEMLVDFHGSVDPEYPGRLADRVRFIVSGGISHDPVRSVELARRHFDYDLLAERARRLVRRLLSLPESAEAATSRVLDGADLVSGASSEGAL
jgi:glycosyltransferase involved in cell wall biosynthesis